MASRSGLRPRPPNAQEEAAAAARGEKGRKAASSKIAVGQENPAAGQFGPIQQGSSKVAAPVDRKGSVKLPKERSAESKAAGEEEEALWVLDREGSFKPDSKETPLQIYTEEMVEKTGKPLKPKAADAVASCFNGEKAADAVATGEGAPAAAKKGTRLPDDEVKWILARKREYLTPGISTAEAIEASNYLSDCFTEYQDWVRKEFEANRGIVMLDDEQLERRLKNEQLVQDVIDEMDDISFADLGIVSSDRYSDFYEDESDEEGEEVVQKLNAN